MKSLATLAIYATYIHLQLTEMKHIAIMPDILFCKSYLQLIGGLYYQNNLVFDSSIIQGQSCLDIEYLGHKMYVVRSCLINDKRTGLMSVSQKLQEQEDLSAWSIFVLLSSSNERNFTLLFVALARLPNILHFIIQNWRLQLGSGKETLDMAPSYQTVIEHSNTP